jgi:hypothetical protein
MVRAKKVIEIVRVPDVGVEDLVHPTETPRQEEDIQEDTATEDEEPEPKPAAVEKPQKVKRVMTEEKLAVLKRAREAKTAKKLMQDEKAKMEYGEECVRMYMEKEAAAAPPAARKKPVKKVKFAPPPPQPPVLTRQQAEDEDSEEEESSEEEEEVAPPPKKKRRAARVPPVLTKKQRKQQQVDMMDSDEEDDVRRKPVKITQGEYQLSGIPQGNGWASFLQ